MQTALIQRLDNESRCRRKRQPRERKITIKNRFSALEGDAPEQLADTNDAPTPEEAKAALEAESSRGRFPKRDQKRTSFGDRWSASPPASSTLAEPILPSSPHNVDFKDDDWQGEDTREIDIEKQETIAEPEPEEATCDPPAVAQRKIRNKARKRTSSPKVDVVSLVEEPFAIPEKLEMSGDAKEDQEQEDGVVEPESKCTPANGPTNVGTLGSEESSQISKAAKKRAQKKTRKNTLEVQQAGSETHLQEDQDTTETAAASSQSGPAASQGSTGPELTQKQAQALAELAVRLNEQNIANHLRATASRRILLATPVNPLTISGDDILAVEPGDVLHCEIMDSQGWGFGTIVAPLRLAGTRGCFTSTSMCPVIAEVRTNRDGDTLEFTPGSWSEVAAGQDKSTKTRLREKAALSRIKAAKEKQKS